MVGGCAGKNILTNQPNHYRRNQAMMLPRSNNSRFCRPSSKLLHGRTLREAHTRCLSHAGEILRFSLPQTPVIGRKKRWVLIAFHPETDWMIPISFYALERFSAPLPPPPPPSPLPPPSPDCQGNFFLALATLINFGGGRASLPWESAINATTSMSQELPK